MCLRLLKWFLGRHKKVRMELETTIYVYNENGLLNPEEINFLCDILKEKLSPEFKYQTKDDIDASSSIFFRFSSEKVDFTIYDHGYVMKIEGDVSQSVELVKILNDSMSMEKEIYVSPSQRVVNDPKLRIDRNLNLADTAAYLDRVFMVEDYTESIKSDKV